MLTRPVNYRNLILNTHEKEVGELSRVYVKLAKSIMLLTSSFTKTHLVIN